MSASERFSFTISKAIVLFDYLVLFVLALVPFSRMGITGLWNIHDQAFPLDPIERLQKISLQAWNHFGGTGYPSYAIVQQILRDFLRAGLVSVGMPVNIAQRVLLVFTLAFMGWGMYYMVKIVFSFREQKIARVASLVAAIFYMMNPFLIYWLKLGSFPQLYFGSAALPFIFAFMFQGFNASENKKPWIKYAVLTAFSSMFLFTVHPEIEIITLMFFTMFVVFYVLCDVLARRVNIFLTRMRFLVTAVAASIGMNLWWLVPIAYAFISTDVPQLMISYSSIERVGGFSSYPLIAMQALRFNIFPFNWQPPIGPARQWVTSPFIVLIGFFLFSLASLSLLFRSRNRDVLFFALTTIVFIGFSMGLNPPFGIIYLWLWDNFVLFRIVSDPFKFLYLAVFTFSVLLGVSTAESYKWLLRQTRKHLHGSSVKIKGKSFRQVKKYIFKGCPNIFLCVTMAFILVNSYPLLSGNLFGALEPLNIPSYYMDAREWLKQQDGDFRILVMPQPSLGVSASYSWSPSRNLWDYYSMVPVSFSLDVFPEPVFDWMLDTSFSPRLIQSQIFMQYVYNQILYNGTKSAGKLLSLLAVKYIVVQRDFVNNVNRTYDISSIEHALQRQEDLRFVKAFGELLFYENKAYKDNLIYGTTAYVILPERSQLNIYKMLCESYENFFPSEIAIFFLQQLPNAANFIESLYNWPNGYIVGLTYKKISSTKYEVYVKTNESFVLVFSESYDPEWNARIDGKSTEPKHFVVNGYANGWYIDRTGEFTIVLEYESQKYLDWGILGSIGFMLIVIVVFVIRRMFELVRKRFWRT